MLFRSAISDVIRILAFMRITTLRIVEHDAE
jgi:hypothetical protein